MKKNLYYYAILIIVLVSSCYDDLGNYDYKEVEDPKVTGLEGETFVGYVGDSLIIEPTIEHSLKGTSDLVYEWNIYNHVDLRGEYYYGPTLRMLFNLKPEKYTTKLTIENKRNGMKYFYKFEIEGRTEFTTGTVVLSDDEGVGRLSFIKGSNTLQPNIFEGIHGENLPMSPKQILIVDHFWLKAYHVLTGEVGRPGVILDASTMMRVRNLEDNFFSTPNNVTGSSLVLNPSGVSAGVFNGRLFGGTWQTCPCSPIYGFYGEPAAGEYSLSPYFNYYGSHYLGYDVEAKRLVQFDINLRYQGASYTVIPMGEGTLFDPKNMGVDLIYMKNINSETTYAFGKDEDGTIYEYKFQDVPGLVFPKQFRTFTGSDLIDENTKWATSTLLEVFYFSSGDKVYRYNPINETLSTLDGDFNGETITMLKLVDENLLIAGTEGTLHYMDVSTGKNGNIYRVIENIPGNPVDVVVRK